VVHRRRAVERYVEHVLFQKLLADAANVGEERKPAAAQQRGQASAEQQGGINQWAE
jgi:hypothetical protein